jgi:hypothetical protein
MIIKEKIIKEDFSAEDFLNKYESIIPENNNNVISKNGAEIGLFIKFCEIIFSTIAA